MVQDVLPGIRQFDLTGKAAIITGGSKGLGLAMAAGLASAGCDILLVNRSALDGERSAAELCISFGTRVLSYAADITREEEVARGFVDNAQHHPAPTVTASIAASLSRVGYAPLNTTSPPAIPSGRQVTP